MSATLRATRWEDLDALASIEQDVYGPDAWSSSSWWSELAGRPRRSYVTLTGEGGAILGYAGLDLGPDVADVMTITLTPAARGAGHAHTLMGWLVETATAAGAAHLMLEVRADNVPALALYDRWGFRRVSQRRGYYADGVDALILRRPLAPEARETMKEIP